MTHLEQAWHPSGGGTRCNAMAFSRPGRSDVRSTSSPTTKGFTRRTATPGQAGTVEVAVAEEGVRHRLADTEAEQHLAQHGDDAVAPR